MRPKQTAKTLVAIIMQTKNLIFIISIFVFTLGCSDNKTNDKTVADRFYYVSNSQSRPGSDTTYVDSLNHNVKGLEQVFRKPFDALSSGVIKYAEYGGPADSQYLCYYTDEFGVMYSKNITWGGFSRLHSTNDSVEKRINKYFDFILSNQSLVLAGEDYVQYADSEIILHRIRDKNNSH